MKVYPDCFPCFFRQSTIAFDQAGLEKAEQNELLRDIACVIGEAELSGSPAHVTTHIHRLIRSRTGVDPFGEVKRLYNDKALQMYDRLKEQVRSSPDPLLTASRLAIAGNIIDFGIFTAIDIEGTVERALEEEIAIDDFSYMSSVLGKPKNVLYLLDNAGEIVFDRLLIETLLELGSSVTAVVKGGAVLNDALMDDAVQIGLDNICTVIDNGSDAVGTILEWCPDTFTKVFHSAQVLISKGQGNFETLMHEKRPDLFFLFQAKCDVVSRHLGLEKGDMILAHGAGRWRSVQ